MRAITVPQPDFPDITYMKGDPVGGFEVVTFIARATKGGVVTYEATFKGGAELTVDESAKIAATMKKYGDAKSVAVDVALKEIAPDDAVKK